MFHRYMEEIPLVREQRSSGISITYQWNLCHVPMESLSRTSGTSPKVPHKTLSPALREMLFTMCLHDFLYIVMIFLSL